MMDAQQSVAQKKAVMVYEATARSVGSTGNLNVVLTTIIESMFKDWPGNSGVTQHYELALPPR